MHSRHQKSRRMRARSPGNILGSKWFLAHVREQPGAAAHAFATPEAAAHAFAPPKVTSYACEVAWEHLME